MVGFYLDISGDCYGTIKYWYDTVWDRCLIDANLEVFANLVSVTHLKIVQIITINRFRDEDTIGTYSSRGA